MEEDFNPEKIETVIASLKKKEKSLADSIGKLGVNLENEIQTLNELKKKERKSNSKKANNQINKRVTEIAKLTVQFVDHLDLFTKKGLYAHRLALISTYKPLMHWMDQEQFDQLLTDKDKNNGFKELCDKNLFLKLKHTDPKLFNRCTECLVS
ncbi:MAG: hypothetical protein IC227_00640 [Enterococcus lacertideformus]|uniref:Uncharacterized protein n=1 Tax=Enterococcus lacertideformus TaxID=2771493 RepID=A0A931FA82_9ENTE|nr:hypothetical protein [Enterococcus lacertideformus]